MTYTKLLFALTLTLLTIGGTTRLMAQPTTSMYGDRVKADVKLNYVYTLEEALKRAKAEKKYIFFNCFADWAMPCHGMNKYVFSDAEFGKYMNKHFVNLFIDVSKRENRHIVQRFQISSFAHYLILDANGEIVMRIVGGKQLPDFKNDLQLAFSSKTSLRGAEKNYLAGKRSKKDLLNYLYALYLADEQEKLTPVITEYFSKISSQEYWKAENWNYFKKLVPDTQSEMFQFLLKNKDKFVKENGLETVNFFLESHYCTDIVPMAFGTGSYDAQKLMDVRFDMQKADLPDTCLTYALYDIAKLRGERKYEEMLFYIKHNASRLGTQKFSLDLTLDLPEMTDSERQLVIDHLNSAAADTANLPSPAAAQQLTRLAKRLQHTEGVVFEHTSFEQALAKAKDQGKKLFLDAYTSWCAPCKKMTNEVFVEGEVGHAFASKFVSIKIDMEKGEGPTLAKRYEVSAYPTLLILDAEGKELKRIVGYRSPQQLLEEVKEF